METSNAYMKQVMAEQAEVEQKLNAPAKRKRSAQRRMALPGAAQADAIMVGAGDGGNNDASDTPAIEVRITGWLRWKRVIVPPNAHVVHTRIGHKEPLTCGLGISFPFNPYTDSFLVVPAAMQTIMIAANCICRERQGILVQGYVQWIVDDFKRAYRKLDFSDPVEPMRVVNTQLREQAEATIKDTVASMGIDEVLADKQPIVQVLTSRLRQLAEGSEGKEGLGLRIITVQIKEAVISSTRLWEALQRPFRAERYKTARLAELEHEAVVHESEVADREARAALEIKIEAAVAEKRAHADAKAFDRDQAEAVRRAALEAESLELATQRRKEALEAQAQLRALELTQNLEHEAQISAHKNRQLEEEIRLDAARRAVENDLSPGLVQERLINKLPEIASSMPKPDELKSISLSGMDGVAPLIADLTKLVDAVRAPSP